MTERAVFGSLAGWIDDQMGVRPTSVEGTRLLLEQGDQPSGITHAVLGERLM